ERGRDGLAEAADVLALPGHLTSAEVEQAQRELTALLVGRLRRGLGVERDRRVDVMNVLDEVEEQLLVGQGALLDLDEERVLKGRLPEVFNVGSQHVTEVGSGLRGHGAGHLVGYGHRGSSSASCAAATWRCIRTRDRPGFRTSAGRSPARTARPPGRAPPGAASPPTGRRSARPTPRNWPARRPRRRW